MAFDDPSPADGAVPLMPDAHGRAALLLVECLVHGLCENSLLTAQQALEIAESAISVYEDHADGAGGMDAAMRPPHTLLTAIAASLRADDPDTRSPVSLVP